MEKKEDFERLISNCKECINYDWIVQTIYNKGEFNRRLKIYFEGLCKKCKGIRWTYYEEKPKTSDTIYFNEYGTLYLLPYRDYNKGDNS